MHFPSYKTVAEEEQQSSWENLYSRKCPVLLQHGVEIMEPQEKSYIAVQWKEAMMVFKPKTGGRPMDVFLPI